MAAPRMFQRKKTNERPGVRGGAIAKQIVIARKKGEFGNEKFWKSIKGPALEKTMPLFLGRRVEF